METIKINNNTIETVKSEIKEIRRQYDYGFLKQQLLDIQAQQDRDNMQREKEKLEVLNLIAEADKLGVSDRIEIIEALPVEEVMPVETPPAEELPPGPVEVAIPFDER